MSRVFLNKNKGLLATLLAVVLITVTVIATASLYAVDNVEISRITFVKNYRSIALSWSYDSSSTATYTADFFAVFRAKDGAGLDAQRVAVLPGSARSYTDVSLVPQQTYYYAVVHGAVGDALSSVSTSTLSWSAGQQILPIGPQSDVCINPPKWNIVLSGGLSFVDGYA